jgi:hypothetical protein
MGWTVIEVRDAHKILVSKLKGRLAVDMNIILK